MKVARWVFLSLFAVGVAHAARYERYVGWHELPPSTQRTMAQKAQGGRIMRIQREYDHGRWLYEAKVKYPGHRRTTKIEVDPYGNLVHIH